MSAPARRRRADSIAAESTFRAQVAELGGEVLEPHWLGSLKPHRVRCAQGHEHTPRPNSLQQGTGLCRASSWSHSWTALAEQEFRARIAELGGAVVGEYVNTRTRVACLCPQGHECAPTPASIQRGNGMCLACAGKDPGAAAARFQARVAELGGRVVGEYTKSLQPVECRCKNDHRCSPRPNDVLQGAGLCRACVEWDTSAGAARFRVLIEQRGGTVAGEYVNNKTPVHCVCPRGHECAPRPHDVAQGTGMCNTCRGAVCDVLYVVTSPTLGRVKFGVTSEDPRPRLAKHRRAGYPDVIRLLKGLPDGAELERHVLATLRDAGLKAVAGREYFDVSVLGTVIDVVDGWTVA